MVLEKNVNLRIHKNKKEQQKNNKKKILSEERQLAFKHIGSKVLCEQLILIQNFRNGECIVIDPLSKVLGREDLKTTYFDESISRICTETRKFKFKAAIMHTAIFRSL